MALKAIEHAQKGCPRENTRHRIEHCTMINDKLLAWMARLGVMALPFGSYLWQHGEKLRPFYGQRADRMFAHGSFLRAGVRVAGSSITLPVSIPLARSPIDGDAADRCR